MIESSPQTGNQTIWMFRHGRSFSNASKKRKVLLPKLFARAYRLVGQDRSLQLVKIIDFCFRGEHTPFKVAEREIPLDPLGHEQSYRTGVTLFERGIRPDVMIVSTYLRAIQSATGIAAGIFAAGGNPRSIVIIYSDIIRERWNGTTAGYPTAYFPVFFPDVHADFLAHKNERRVDFRPPGGESIRDIRENRLLSFKMLLDHLLLQTIIIVGHGTTNSAIHSLLTGEPIETVRIGSPNMGAYKFTRKAGQRLWSSDKDYDGRRPIYQP